VIGRIEGSDEPNGYLEEGSMMTVQRQIAAGMEMDHVKLALLGQDIYLQNGITTAQDGATSHETLELFKDLAEKEKWKMDLVMYPTVVDNPEDMKVNEKYAKQYYRSEEHTSELQSRFDLVCRLLLEKKNKGEREESQQ